jgi:small subunit ribosomal protein S8
MSANHLISALVSSINNAGIVNKSNVNIPYSNVLLGILQILEREGFIAKYDVYEKTPNVRYIKVFLKYVRGQHSIKDFHIVSKPGKRMYSSPKSLHPYYDSLGFYILSTSKGVITDVEARTLNVGGEILCKVF